MTTVAHQQNQNRHNFFAGFLLVLFVVILFISVTALGTHSPIAATVKPIPQIQHQPHAVERHGADALAIRKCLNDKGGADQIWRSYDKRTYFLWCHLPDGRWGFMAIVRDAVDRLWYESTSFVKGDGSMGALLKYMEKFGTRFNGPYPW